MRRDRDAIWNLFPPTPDSSWGIVVGRVSCIPEIAADPALLRAAHDRTFCAACNCLLNMFRHADRDLATLRRCLALLRVTAYAPRRNPRSRPRSRLTSSLLSYIKITR